TSLFPLRTRRAAARRDWVLSVSHTRDHRLSSIIFLRTRFRQESVLSLLPGLSLRVNSEIAFMADVPPPGVSGSSSREITPRQKVPGTPDSRDAQFRALSDKIDAGSSPQSPPSSRRGPDVPLLSAQNPIVLAQAQRAPVAAPQAQVPDIPPDRKAKIDGWINDKASPGFWGSLWGGSEGGNLAGALKGESDLGRLSFAEESYLLSKTVEHMRRTHGATCPTDIEELGRSMKGNGALSSRVATQLAGMAADAMAKFLDNPKGGPVDEGAIASAAVAAIGDNEPALRGMILG